MKPLPKTIDELLNAGFFPIDTLSQPMVYKNFRTQKELYLYPSLLGDSVEITDKKKKINQ